MSELVWTEFTSSIRILLSNKYVFKPFWDFQNQKRTEAQWQQCFKEANAFAHKALGKKHTEDVLAIVFSRLYTLRNQLVHGGATWNGQINRDQIRDGVNFLSKFIPSIVAIMLDNPNVIWGEASFPVIKE